MTVKTYKPEEVELTIGGHTFKKPIVGNLEVIERKRLQRLAAEPEETVESYLQRSLDFALQPLLEKPIGPDTQAEATALVIEVVEDFVDRGLLEDPIPKFKPRVLIDSITRTLHVEFTDERLK